MKLLMITGDRALAEGKRGAFYNTMEEFHKYWDRVDIITPKIQNSKSENLNIFGNVFLHPSPWPLIFQPLWILREGLRIFRSNKPDLMTVHEYPPFYNGVGARLLWNKVKIPYVLEIHHIPGHPRSAGIKEEIYKNLIRLFISWDSTRAKAVRVVNEKQVPEFLIESGISKNKIICIPSLYIDLDIFKPLNIKKEFDIIFIGRLESNKGIDLFLDAAKNLDSKIIIVGDGTLRKSMELKAKSYNLNAVFHGWAKDQNEIAELLNRSKIMVMPSYNEGGPRVVIEAMACGVPVLATPVGIVLDVIKDAGLLTDWDAEDLAEKAKKLLGDELLREFFGRNGAELAKQFEKKAMIKNYADKLINLK